MSDLFKNLTLDLDKAIDSLRATFSKIRTGRANPEVLESIKIEYYGALSPISQVASITIEEANILKIVPWEKHLVPEIEKAILQSDLGFNPVSHGDLIRIVFPLLTEERRKEFVKLSTKEAELVKVSIRTFRREILENFKKQLKAKEISEDEEKIQKQKIEKITSNYIEKVDQMLSEKEKDLMTV